MKYGSLLVREKSLAADLAMIKTIGTNEDQERYLLFKFMASCNELKAKALGLMRD